VRRQWRRPAALWARRDGADPGPAAVWPGAAATEARWRRATALSRGKFLRQEGIYHDRHYKRNVIIISPNPGARAKKQNPVHAACIKKAREKGATMVTYGQFIDVANSEVAAAVSEPNKDEANKKKPVDPPELDAVEVADVFPEDIPALLHVCSDNASQQHKTPPKPSPTTESLPPTTESLPQTSVVPTVHRPNPRTISPPHPKVVLMPAPKQKPELTISTSFVSPGQETEPEPVLSVVSSDTDTVGTIQSDDLTPVEMTFDESAHLERSLQNQSIGDLDRGNIGHGRAQVFTTQAPHALCFMFKRANGGVALKTKVPKPDSRHMHIFADPNNENRIIWDTFDVADDILGGTTTKSGNKLRRWILTFDFKHILTFLWRQFLMATAAW